LSLNFLVHDDDFDNFSFDLHLITDTNWLNMNIWTFENNLIRKDIQKYDFKTNYNTENKHIAENSGS
jgi:uncharacterized membrane protein YfhO